MGFYSDPTHLAKVNGNRCFIIFYPVITCLIIQDTEIFCHNRIQDASG